MPPIGSPKWCDILGFFIGVCIGLAILGVGVIAVRYAIHPQQFRDNVYQVTKTVYVVAKTQNP